MRQWAVHAICGIYILLLLLHVYVGAVTDSVTEYSLADQNVVYELEPMLWNISASPFLRVNITFSTTYRTGRILTILARSPDDVIKNIFVATIQVKDEHFTINIIDEKDKYLVSYMNKDTISIDGTQNTFIFLWNLTVNAFTVNDYTFTVDENRVLQHELLQVHLNIGNYGSMEGLASEGTISIAGLEEVDEVIGEGNSTLEEASYLDRLSKLLQANNISASDIMDKIKTVEDKADKRLRQMCSAHEKSQCLYAEACKRDLKRSTFTCHCRKGYGGTFCQFSLFPRTCHDVIRNNRSAGVYEIDLDGSGPTPATYVQCSEKGETIVETNVPKDVRIRSFKDSGNKYYPIMYRLFSIQQLEILKEMSSFCEQKISYNCVGAPLRFDRNATWFESAGFDFPIRSLGTESHYYGCACSVLGDCKTCHCDSSSANITDTGRFLNEKSGITKIFTKRILPTHGQALLNLGPLVCSGHRGHSDQFSFTFTSKSDYIELGFREDIRHIYFEFRTSQWNIDRLINGVGNRGSNFFMAMENGHRLRFYYEIDVKNNVSVVLDVPTPLNDRKWHRISVEIVKEEVRLGVDEYNEYKGVEDFIALSMSMFVGGYKAKGMVGCMRNIRMNHKLEGPGFKTAGITYGCPNLCRNVECHEKMECIEDFTNTTGHCECKNSLTQYGDHCEHDINANSEVSFHDANSAFLQYINQEIPANPLNSSIVLSFRTDQRQALLLYAHDQFDNFIQIHLQNEYELVLTMNNESEVKTCRITAGLANEFSKMRWVQISVKQYSDSVIFEADKMICELKGHHVLSNRPITNFTGNLDEAIFPPHSPVPIIAVHRYTTLFIGGVPRINGIKSRKDRALRRVYYDTEIPSLLGCIRGVAFPRRNGDKRRLEMRNGGFKVENSNAIQMGCSNACDLIKCQNGGFCSIEWHTTQKSSLAKVGCECDRTSFMGQDCSKDYGLRFDGQVSLGYDVTKQIARVHSVEQRLSFAFSTKGSRRLRAEQRVMTISFNADHEFLIILCKNGSLNFVYRGNFVATTTIAGNFSDGFRHFIQLNFRQEEPLRIAVDSVKDVLDVDLDPNSMEEIWLGSGSPEEVEKTARFSQKFEGCISNLLVTFFDETPLILTPLKAYLDWKTPHKDDFYLHPENAEPLGLASCAEFEKPGKLPIEQTHVQLPIWDAIFEPIYFNDTPVSIILPTPVEYDYVIILVVVLFILFVTMFVMLIGYLFCLTKFPNNKQTKSPRKGTSKPPHTFMPTREDLRKSQTPLLSESPSTLLDQELQSNDAYSELSRPIDSPIPHFPPLSTFRSLNSTDLIQPPSSLPIIGEAADEICFADGE